VLGKINKGEKGMSGDEVAAAVLHLMGDLGVNEKQAPVSQGATPAKWSAPPQDQLKINADGSFIPETLQGSWGFIIRDHEGEGILAGAGRLHAVPDAPTVEVAACSHALQTATNYGISRIQLETESSVLKQALLSSSMDLAACGMLIKYSFIAERALCM
jgi:hypothetical protein